MKNELYWFVIELEGQIQDFYFNNEKELDIEDLRFALYSMVDSLIF